MVVRRNLRIFCVFIYQKLSLSKLVWTSSCDYEVLVSLWKGSIVLSLTVCEVCPSFLSWKVTRAHLTDSLRPMDLVRDFHSCALKSVKTIHRHLLLHVSDLCSFCSYSWLFGPFAFFNLVNGPALSQEYLIRQFSSNWVSHSSLDWLFSQDLPAFFGQSPITA